MIRDFEAQNPDVLVEIVAKNGYPGIHEAVLAEMPDGELPDLAVAFPSMIAEYAKAGLVAPLDAYLNDPEVGLTDEDLADIYPGYLDAAQLPGFGRQIMAFPFFPKRHRHVGQRHVAGPGGLGPRPGHLGGV